MDDDSVIQLEGIIRRIITNYDRNMKELGISEEDRKDFAQRTLRQTFYTGATNTSDFPLIYKDFEFKDEEDRKMKIKVDTFEKILGEYLNS